MTGPDTIVSLALLLEESLAAWQCPADLSVRADGTEVIRLNGDVSQILVNVRRAPPSMPFRWVVELGGRERTAASVVGVLRIVRQAVAADYQPARLRLAPPPVLAP
jgi:hypothetical protein